MYFIIRIFNMSFLLLINKIKYTFFYSYFSQVENQFYCVDRTNHTYQHFCDKK